MEVFYASLDKFETLFHEPLRRTNLAGSLLRHFSILCLQIAYLKLKSIISDPKETLQVALNAQKMSRIRHWLMRLSNQTPEMGYTTIFASGINFLLSMCLYISPSWSQGHSSKLYELSVIKYFASPKDAKKETEAQLNQIIEQSERSNLHYRDQLLTRNRYKLYQNHQSTIGSFKIADQRLRIIDENAEDGSRMVQIQIGLLSRQYQHLEQLKWEKSLVWPDTRKSFYLKKHLKRSRKLNRIFNLLFYMIHQYRTVVSLSMASEYLKQPNYRRDTEDLRLLFLFNLTNDFITAATFGEAMASQFVVSIVAAMDQLKLLDSIRKRIAQFLRLTRMLENILYQNRRGTELSIEREIDIRSRCDKEAIDIYISLRFFLQQLESTLSHIKSTIDALLYVCLVDVCLALMCHNKATTPIETSFVFWTSICLFLTLEGRILIVAILSSHTRAALRSGWSIIACSVEPTDDQESSRLPEHMDLSLVSSHSVQLWRRLIHDDQQISRLCYSKLFGIGARIDYNLIWRLNLICDTFAASTIDFKRG